MYEVSTLQIDPQSRRTFMTRMGSAGLGAIAAALLAGCGGSGSSSASATGVSSAVRAAFPGVSGASDNVVVLNYALTLETLEAYLYMVALNAASGLALTTPLNANASAYVQNVGNGTVASSLAAPGYLYLVQFAYVEAAHRDFLTAALGTNASPVVPADGKYKFATADGTPGTDLGTILSNVYPLEETGTRAYLGALPYLTDNTTAQTAGTIYSTECRHSAALAYILGKDPGPSRSIPGVPTPEQEVASEMAPNIFEKFLAPAVVLTAASSAYFA